AELLASMYDASLDQFQPHTWNFNPIQKPIYYSSMQRNAVRSFGMSGFRVYNAQNYVNFPYQNYDQLNWFGFYFGDGRDYLRKTLSGRVAGISVVENEAMEEVVVSSYA